ncbi:SA1362 family protein [Geobacillus jurassicus]|uniref:SA1362 family protein n=1 Tax=Geobacillus jurassicus TaxID=235932 RepID=A0ABV6GSP5_9BACL|nr:SA1362 family protein [Geobacillus jurassicus]
MRRRAIHPLVGLMILLGTLGIVYTLFAHPTVLFRQLLFVALFLAAIYLFYRFVYQRRTDQERLSYLKAVRQSKKLHPRSGRKQAKPAKLKRPLKKRTAIPHLTVIEGKKGKKKNRASF